MENGRLHDARALCLREARRVLRDDGDAEDAAQEALLRIWRHGGDRPSPAWQRTVARNEALRTLDRRRRRPTPTEQDEIAAASWSSAETDDATSAVAVGQLLSRLPAGDRELVRLRYFEDLTQREVARTLGAAEGTVKVRLHRLRAQLRQRAGDDLS